jgi:hypothetical protein
MGDLSNFERGQIIVACLAAASGKNCHIIRCTESDSFSSYVGIHESCEDNISKEKQ